MAMKVGVLSMIEDAESKELNHLGLVAGMFDELEIGETIDSLIKQDLGQRKVSIGQAVKAMVLNGLGFANQRLYLLPHFFEGKPIEQLFDGDICAADLNDDVMGRTLDALFTADVSNVYMRVAHKALKILDLSCFMSHIDSTTFHTDGKYDFEEETGVINIVKGYSRDHRPELNQFGLKLIVESQAGIPMMMEVLSGNDNDKTRFKETIRDHIGLLKDDFKTEHMLGDSALYCAETLRLMDGLLWTTRVPETIALARDLIAQQADELASENDGEKPNFISTCVTYAGINQHWITIFSPEARKRSIHTISRQCEKKSSSDQKLFEKFCKQTFACERDAFKALKELEKKLSISTVHDSKVVEKGNFNRRGRPANDATPDSFSYSISGYLASDHDYYAERLKRKSCFIIATNQTDTDLMSGDKMLADYKGQQTVERGFRFLKDPMFLASSVFLKSPKRIMALTMVMTICLLVYAALEHRIRESLKKNGHTFPNQVGKMVKNPTVRWVFQYFQNIPVIYLLQKKAAILNLKEHHHSLLKLLGDRYLKLYS